VRKFSCERARVHARARFFSRGICVGDEEGVSVCETAAELVQQIGRTRVSVRLEEGDDPPSGEAKPRGSQVRTHLGRVVSVAVHDSDACGLADVFEAAGGAAKFADRGDDV